MQVGRMVRAHGRRMAVEVANVVLNHEVVFRAIGAVNGRAGFIESVFLMYPATDKYAQAIAYPSRIRKHKWSPGPAGLMVMNGKVGIIFGVTASVEHFRDEAHHESLVDLANRMEHLRVLVGARQKTFAGVLPGVLASHGILTDPPEGDITANVVAQAVRDLRTQELRGAPVIVLGGRGFVGRRLVALLSPDMQVHSLDATDGEDSWPDHLDGQPVLLVNVANRRALGQHLHRLWAGMAVLNEVYPEPDPDTLATLTLRGIPVHHVVGVAARAIPAFPAAYQGAIPCCAAWPSEDAQVVVRHLNPDVEPVGSMPQQDNRPEPGGLGPVEPVRVPEIGSDEGKYVHVNA